MGFSLFEIGSRSGRPIGLYEFRWKGEAYGLDVVWRFTSADQNVEWGGHTWTAIPITDDGYSQGASPEPLVVSLPAALEVAQLYRSTPPAKPIWLTVYHYHRDDPDDQKIVYWVGTVGNIKRVSPIKAECYGLPISGTIKRQGLRLCYERGCPHAVYDNDCRVIPDLFRHISEITAKDGSSITILSAPPFNTPRGPFEGDAFVGGFLEWGGATAAHWRDRRTIEAYEGGSQFRIFGSTDRIPVSGAQVYLHLGCDQTTATCKNVFNNLANNGGWKFLPGTSPFDGQPLFY